MVLHCRWLQLNAESWTAETKCNNSAASSDLQTIVFKVFVV